MVSRLAVLLDRVDREMGTMSDNFGCPSPCVVVQRVIQEFVEFDRLELSEKAELLADLFTSRTLVQGGPSVVNFLRQAPE